MEAAALITEISQKDAEIAAFARLAISDAAVRGELVRQMASHDDIMVYYHCFYAVDKASQMEPTLFYPYWETIAGLLVHRNSYHRNFALTILANLTAVDSENRIEPLLPAYLARLNDEKMMTAQCCVQQCHKIVRHKPDLKGQVIDQLLGIDSRGGFTVKQKELLKADVLAVIEAAYPETPLPEREAAFVRSATGSISPKTRKRAKGLVTKYSL